MMDDLYEPRFVSKLTRDTLGLILAGGRGSRLHDFTLWRAKPAIPFGGKYRIIDFTLSNCVNSGIRQIGVISQYKAHSLIRHIQKGWSFLRGEFGEFIELLPAQQRIERSWYLGTADAVYQNIDIIRSHNPRMVIILAGDHVYKMDYGPMLAFHVENNADLTIGCIDVPIDEAVNFGVMEIDNSNRVVDFSEKPDNPCARPDEANVAAVSMGIYVFDTEFLIEHLIKDSDSSQSRHDFGHDIIPSIIGIHRVFAYPFHNETNGKRGYWRDVGTIDSYWKANMELMDITPELNLYDRHWPIWTFQEQTPPAKLIFNDTDRRGIVTDSLISGGCIISGASVNHSLLSSNVHVDDHTVISDSVILPNVVIGKNCRINKSIIDKSTTIPDGTIVGENHRDDKQRFYVSDEGVVLVTPDMLGQKLHFSR